MTGEKGTERPQVGNMTKRRFLTGAVTAVAATTGTTTLGASTATAAPVVGPIEVAWREFCARQTYLDSLRKDVSEAECNWWDTPLYEAAEMTPTSGREWAALLLIALYTREYWDAVPFDDILATIESVLGDVAKIEVALLEY